jgi:hypothetical protein
VVVGGLELKSWEHVTDVLPKLMWDASDRRPNASSSNKNTHKPYM